MKKYPIFLNFDEIFKYRNSLKTTDEKIDYYNYIIDAYKESFNNKSDKDVDSYIRKYGLRNKIEKIKFEIPDEALKSHWFEVDDIFTKPFYNKLHEKTSYLVKSLTSELVRLRLYKDIIEDRFDLVLLQSEFYSKVESFESDVERLIWIKTLYKKLRSIMFSFSGKMIDDFLKLYNYDNSFYGIEPSISGNESNPSNTRISYKIYLEQCYFPVVEKGKEELEMKVNIDYTKQFLTKEIKDEEQLFPLWNYKYEKVKHFCDNAFTLIEDKIKYLSYVIKCLKIKVPINLNSHELYPEYLKLSEELNHLRTTYEMENNKNLTSSPSDEKFLQGLQIILEPLKDLAAKTKDPKFVFKINKENSKLIKHFVDIAKQGMCFPGLGDLASNGMSDSGWSRKLNESAFLYELQKKIEANLNSKKTSKKFKQLFIILKSEVDIRLSKALIAEKNKTGQKNKHNTSYNEDYNEPENILDDDDLPN